MMSYYTKMIHWLYVHDHNIFLYNTYGITSLSVYTIQLETQEGVIFV